MDETVTVENPQAWLPRAEWVKTQPQTLLASCVLLLDGAGRVLLLRYAPGQPAAGNWWLTGVRAGSSELLDDTSSHFSR